MECITYEYFFPRRGKVKLPTSVIGWIISVAQAIVVTVILSSYSAIAFFANEGIVLLGGLLSVQGYKFITHEKDFLWAFLLDYRYL